MTQDKVDLCSIWVSAVSNDQDFINPAVMSFKLEDMMRSDRGFRTLYVFNHLSIACCRGRRHLQGSRRHDEPRKWQW